VISVVGHRVVFMGNTSAPKGTSRGMTVGQTVFGIACAAGAGAYVGFTSLGTARGALLGALALGFFFGKNVLIMAIRPRLRVALGIGLMGGFCAGLFLSLLSRVDMSAWVGGIVLGGLGVVEVWMAYKRHLAEPRQEKSITPNQTLPM
jgi:hypothetical protein